MTAVTGERDGRQGGLLQISTLPYGGRMEDILYSCVQEESSTACAAAVCSHVARYLHARADGQFSRGVLSPALAYVAAVPLPFIGVVTPQQAKRSRPSSFLCPCMLSYLSRSHGLPVPRMILEGHGAGLLWQTEELSEPLKMASGPWFYGWAAHRMHAPAVLQDSVEISAL